MDDVHSEQQTDASIHQQIDADLERDGSPETQYDEGSEPSEADGAAQVLSVNMDEVGPFLEVLPVASMLVDEDGALVAVNEMAVQLLGRPREEVLGDSFASLFMGIPSATFDPVRMRRLSGQVNPRVVLAPLVAHRDGQGTTVPVEVSIGGQLVAPIDGRPLAVVTFRDLTEAVAAHDEMRAAHAEATTRAEDLRRRHHQLELVSKTAELVQTAHDEEEIFPVLDEFGPRMFPDTAAAVYMRDMSRVHLLKQARWDDPHIVLADTIAESDCWALRLGRICGSHRPDDAPRCRHVPPDRSYACVPVFAADQSIGLVTIVASDPDATVIDHDAAAEATLTALVGNIGLTIANVRLRASLELQSIRDPLTGLYNRRYMEDTINRELRRATRHNRALSLAIIDIDHFKAFNDTYGHDAADSMLRDVSRMIERRIRRDEDTACRYGGDELVVVIPDATSAHAAERMEDMRNAISEMRVQYLGNTYPALSVTVGIASFPDDGDTLATLLHAADQALLSAKRTGRNRVVASETVVDLTAAEGRATTDRGKRGPRRQRRIAPAAPPPQ